MILDIFDRVLISIQDLAAAERARKNVENERDELMEELTSGSTSRYVYET